MIGYLINGSHRAISSDQKLSEKFQASLDALRPITLNLCSLKDEAKEYEFTAISIKRKLVGDDVENKSCVLSVKKSVIGGTLNISTPVRWIETDSDDIFKVPIIGDLPFIGSIFTHHVKSRETSYIFITITVTIIDDK